MAKKKKPSGLEKSIKKIEEIKRLRMAQGRRQAFDAAIKAPSIVSTGVDDLKTGDSPEEEKNDSGYGTHINYPTKKCTDCKAAFHTSDRLDLHTIMHHAPDDQLIG